MLQKNKKLSSFVRLLASLCLIGGLSVATTGCLGGGGGGGGNNGNNGDSCASGEIEYNGQCYNECASADECNEGESCTPIGDTGDSVCIQTSSEDTGMNDTGTDTGTDTGGGTGDGSCADILECAQTCRDQACLDGCMSDGTADAQSKFDDFATCRQGQGECDAELSACLGCSDSETIIGLSCVASCSADGDCASGEICDEPILQPGETVCSHDVSTLGDGCSEAADCEGPDSEEVVQGQGFCSTEDANGDPIPGGICYAVGCNTNGQQVAYGPTTGCGLDAFCLAQQDGQGGTIGVCLALCRETADCPRGLDDGYTCSVFQKDDSGNLGTCDPACETDADCERTDQQGNTIAGRCNTDGYCEQPCDPNDASSCTDAGGTCEDDGSGNNYCVF